MAKHFEEALRIVLAKDTNKYRNLLDNLRVALEQLLKDVLGNKKPLEKQKEVLLPWLAARGAHKQTVNLYSDFLNRFTQYQNDAVKHGEAWSEPDIEFMIYTAGALMRRSPA